MPLKPSEILQALDRKQTEFQDFHQTTLKVLEKYRKALSKVAQQPDAEITQGLMDHHNPGGRPLEALGNSPNWIIPSKLKWSSREQSLEWVRERLMGITTFAVDGSQVYPSKDISIPIGMVQVGWFENPHLPLGSYDKDVRLEVLSPEDLKPQDRSTPMDRLVNMHRFRMEIQRMIEFMESHTNRSDCLVFLDGSLVATFAEKFDAECRRFYVQQLVELLQASEKFRVPLVAYIDTSRARDLVQLLHCLKKLPEAPSLNDAALLGVNMNWGDRTPIFRCDRKGETSHQGILQDYGDQAESVAFTYLKTHEGPPARIEMPTWIYEAGLHSTVLDFVRGEVIIGGGYPYVIETADRVAVLQAEDRQIFFRLLQEWAEKEEINLRFSRKMISKVLRRGN